MHSSARRISAVVLGVALTGCSTPGPAPAPPAPVSAPASFDGKYIGTIRTTAQAPEIRRGWCDTPSRFSVSVKNNAFTYVLAHPNLNLPASVASTFQAAIGPDGSFGAQTTNGNTSMTGRITETGMAGQINGEGCDYAFGAQRS